MTSVLCLLAACGTDDEGLPVSAFLPESSGCLSYVSLDSGDTIRVVVKVDSVANEVRILSQASVSNGPVTTERYEFVRGGKCVRQQATGPCVLSGIVRSGRDISVRGSILSVSTDGTSQGVVREQDAHVLGVKREHLWGRTRSVATLRVDNGPISSHVDLVEGIGRARLLVLGRNEGDALDTIWDLRLISVGQCP